MATVDVVTKDREQRKTAQWGNFPASKGQEIPPGEQNWSLRKVSNCQDKGITNHHGSVTALYLQFSSFPNSQMSCCEDPLLQSIEKDVVLSGGNLYHSGNILATGYFSMKSYVRP